MDENHTKVKAYAVSLDRASKMLTNLIDRNAALAPSDPPYPCKVIFEEAASILDSEKPVHLPELSEPLFPEYMAIQEPAPYPIFVFPVRASLPSHIALDIWSFRVESDLQACMLSAASPECPS